MSDARKPAPAVPSATRGPSPTSGSQPRTPTNPQGMRVMSAARTAPQNQKGDAALGKRVASEASNVFLNGLAILKEMVADFSQRDRFFKYKVGIVAGWIAISCVSLAIACPGRSLQTGDMDARIVLGDKLDRPSITIWNESKTPWQDVTIIVNGEYRAAVAEVKAGEFVTITPKQLLGANGTAAPVGLRFQSLQMRSARDSADLTKDLQEEWRRLLEPKR
ncbi:hypothetical protein KRR26_17290 [Corallococcus sp. M34]|nr:hypothetical protein [Citreicoccus inhibens]